MVSCLKTLSKCFVRFHSQQGRDSIASHCGHNKLDPSHITTDIKLLSEEQRLLVKHSNNVSLNSSATSSLLNEMDKDGIKFKKSQISYLTRRERHALQNLDHNASSADSLIEMFKERKNVNYMSVTYDPQS